MSRRKLALSGTVVAAAAALALSTSPAFATGGNEVLTYGGPGASGTNVALTDVLTGSLATGTSNTFEFTSNGSTVTITCTSAALTAHATSNPTAPGTATVAISALTFSDGSTPCTLTGLSGVTVVSAVLKTGTTATASVSDSPDTFTITSLNEAVTLHTGVGNVICDYGTNSTVTSIPGTVTNPGTSGSGGTIVFNSDPVALISGSSFCGAAGSQGTFAATFGDIIDSSGTGSNLSVYVN